jgi:hypothetical protein
MAKSTKTAQPDSPALPTYRALVTLWVHQKMAFVYPGETFTYDPNAPDYPGADGVKILVDGHMIEPADDHPQTEES